MALGYGWRMSALPLPNRLRAFEAAARHLSFAHAARELHLTPAAVSSQVRLLEAELGAALFERLGRGLRLTQMGEAYLPSVRKAFDDLRVSTASLFGQKRRRSLRVRAPVSFATLWLAPRLGRFRQKHPDMDLHIFSSIYADGAPAGECDLEVRFGAGRWAGYRSDLLQRETATVIAHHDLVASLDPPARRAALAVLPRIEIMGLAEDAWDRMLGQFGIAARPRPSISVDTSLAALQLVASGQGAAVVLESFFVAARAMLPIERVVDEPLPMFESHYLLQKAGADPNADTLAFREWIASEAGP
jgi:LysR family glycine cleavage system transcriptional activator